MALFTPDHYNAYTSVNDWFIRDIKPNYRPIATGSDVLTSPADARITVWNNNPEGVKFWIKGP
jgi:phosphatidylserine decarboxylase